MAELDADDFSPKEIATMRWQAIEGFNSAPGLSPMARRLGIALICAMDAKTRNCFPGEVRLATELGVHLSAIKKAKAELRDAKLITWFNPGGPRHLSRYIFGWAALLRLAKEAGERANLIVRKGLSGRRKGTLQGTNGAASNSTRTGTNEPHSRPAQGTRTRSQGTQIEAQGTLQGTPIVPPRVPDITHDITQLDITQQEHDEVGGAPSRRASAPDAPLAERRSPQAEAEGALEKEQAAWRASRKEKLRIARQQYPKAFIDWDDDGKLKVSP